MLQAENRSVSMAARPRRRVANHFVFRFYRLFNNTACIIQQFLNSSNMDETQIVSALAALAHQHRLRIFRLLVRAGPSGVPPGRSPNTLASARRPCRFT